MQQRWRHESGSRHLGRESHAPGSGSRRMESGSHRVRSEHTNGENDGEEEEGRRCYGSGWWIEVERPGRSLGRRVSAARE